MTEITVTSTGFPDQPRKRLKILVNGKPVPDRTPPTPAGVLVEDEFGCWLKTEVVVKNGIADVEPTPIDFDICQNIEDSSAWYNLQNAVKEATRILGSLDDCNYPTLDDRFRLIVALQRIRAGADKLEHHIARSGLWMSEEEWEDCDSRNTWHWF